MSALPNTPDTFAHVMVFSPHAGAAATAPLTWQPVLSWIQDHPDYLAWQGVYEALSAWQNSYSPNTPAVVLIDMAATWDWLTANPGEQLAWQSWINTLQFNPRLTLVGLYPNTSPELLMKSASWGLHSLIAWPTQDKLLWRCFEQVALQQQQWHQAVAAQPHAKPSKLTVVFSAKGGSGASTIAVNLAAAMAQAGDNQCKTVLVDLDPVFANTATFLNLTPTYALGDLAGNAPSDLDPALMAQLMVHHPSGLDVVVASKHVLDDNPIIPMALIERAIQLLLETHQHVVVDLPTHSLDDMHQLLMQAADEILLVSALDVPGLARTKQYLQLAERYLDVHKIKLVLNRATQSGVYGMSQDDLAEQFRTPVHARIPNDWELAVQANSLGQLFYELSDKAPITQAFTTLAYTTLEKPPEHTTAEESSGWLRHLLSRFERMPVQQAKANKASGKTPTS